jgi:hypothetical protein
MNIHAVCPSYWLITNLHLVIIPISSFASISYFKNFQTYWGSLDNTENTHVFFFYLYQ